jgi:protein gp37
MNKSGISWCDYTVNPITGCTKGCAYCYARKVTERYPANYPNGFKPTFYPERLEDIRKMARRKETADIFIGSMGDLFDPAVTMEQIKQVFDACAAAPQHNFLVLTKQAKSMRNVINFAGIKPPTNVWLGITVTNDKDDGNLVNLYNTKHMGHKFVSIEPCLGHVDISLLGGFLSLAIVGGQTPGKPLHETHPEWLSQIIHDCKSIGVPVHYKHAGGGDKNPLFDGKRYDTMPKDIRRIA